MPTDALATPLQARPAAPVGPGGARPMLRRAALVAAALAQGRTAAHAAELLGIDRATGAGRILRNLRDRS